MERVRGAVTSSWAPPKPQGRQGLATSPLAVGPALLEMPAGSLPSRSWSWGGWEPPRAGIWAPPALPGWSPSGIPWLAELQFSTSPEGGSTDPACAGPSPCHCKPKPERIPPFPRPWGQPAPRAVTSNPALTGQHLAGGRIRRGRGAPSDPKVLTDTSPQGHPPQRNEGDSGPSLT